MSESGEAAYVDPSDFAAADDGGESGGEERVTAETTVAEGHAEAEALEPAQVGDMGRTGRWGRVRDALLSTDPSVPLAEVEDPWDPENGGTARMMRGAQKMLGYDGTPAIVDVAIGAIEAVHELQGGGQRDGSNGGGSGGGSDSTGGYIAEEYDDLAAQAEAGS